MRDRLTGELEVLQRFLTDRQQEYRSASFLRCDFDSPVWDCEINKVRFTLDWRIHLPGGSRLTDVRHLMLLTIFKCWLCVQDHPDTSMRFMLAEVTKQRRLQRTLQLIDYFLIHAESLNLVTHGLELLTENDVRSLVSRLAANSSAAVSVYDWPGRLDAYLRRCSAAICDAELDIALAGQPELALAFNEEPLTSLAGIDLIRARAWLWANDMYRPAGSHLPFAWGPDTVRIANDIYANTVWGTRTYKPVPRELLLFPADTAPTEMPRAPVRTQDDERMSIEQLRPNLARLRSLTYLKRIHLPIPVTALSAVKDKSVIGSLKILGRFRTLPQDVVFKALRCAIEFFLGHGSALIDAYLDVARRWVGDGKRCSLGTFASRLDYSQVGTAGFRVLGVTRWEIKRLSNGTIRNVPNSKYFSEFRANAGLLDLMRVLCGCVHICIGTLMARRGGELEELGVDCLDTTRTRLIFHNRKSGIGGKREKIARPIPPIAVEMIEETQRMRRELVGMGALAESGALLAYPSAQSGEMIYGTEALFRSLDLFCDYFEMPLDEFGRRYYIRQHQLRRFFAMLFFWGNSFGGMETLRWFLGQTDVEHLYRYITESVSGAALASIKAGYATDRLLQDAPEVLDLAALLQRRYGAETFSLMTRCELDEHITDLIACEDLTVEPEFFVGSRGKEYRILVRVTAKEAA